MIFGSGYFVWLRDVQKFDCNSCGHASFAVLSGCTSPDRPLESWMMHMHEYHNDSNAILYRVLAGQTESLMWHTCLHSNWIGL